MPRSTLVRVTLVSLAASVAWLTSGVAAAQAGGASISVEVRGEIGLGLPEAGSTPALASALDQHLVRLRSSDPAVRLDATRALGELGDPAAIEPLTNTARTDPRPEIRGWALRSLGRIGTPEAIAVVRVVGQRDTDERVRSLAARILASAPAASTAPTAEAPPPAPVSIVEAQPAAPAPPPDPGWNQPAAAPPQAQVVPQPSPGDVGGEPVVVLMPQEVTDGRAHQLELRRQRRAGLGLRISGWITFGVTYFTSFMAGVGITMEDEDDGWPLMLPLVGPAVMGFRLMDEGENGVAALAIIWSVAEIAGFSMAIAGHVRRARARRSAPARQIAIVPAGPGDGPGLGLAATF